MRLATYASRCIENEILMYFRSRRKSQGELSLSDSLDAEGDGNSLSLIDVVKVDDNMLEELDLRDSCQRVSWCVDTCLTKREAHIIRLRYGLGGRQPLTQRRSPDPMYPALRKKRWRSCGVPMRTARCRSSRRGGRWWETGRFPPAGAARTVR